MGKTKRFVFRLSPQEREMVTELANRLNRSPSDAMRVLLRDGLAATQANPLNNPFLTPKPSETLQPAIHN